MREPQHFEASHARVALRLTLIILLVIAPQCSTNQRYQTLSFFFDGVPDPNAPSPEAGAAAGPDAVGGTRTALALATSTGEPAPPMRPAEHGPWAAEAWACRGAAPWW